MNVYSLFGLPLNGRELAILFQLILMFLLVISLEEARPALKSIVLLLLSPKMLIPLLIIIINAAVIIYLMKCIEVWTPDMIAQAVEMCVVVAIIQTYSTVTNKAPRDMIRGYIKESVSMAAILVIIASLTSFSFTIELIWLSAITLFGMLSVVDKTPNQYTLKISGWITLSYTTAVIINTIIWFASTNMITWMTISLKTVLFAVMFSILFVPTQCLFAYLSMLEGIVLRARIYNEEIPTWIITVRTLAATRLSLKIITALSNTPIAHKQIGRCKTYKDYRNVIKELLGSTNQHVH